MNSDRIIGNRYEIIEMIGKGGMAIVYKAKCLVLNRYVAIKVLRPEFQTDEAFIKRFRAEAQAAGSLSHPNVVSIYDVAQDSGIDYIVMEYVEGVTLKQYIDAKGIIPWKEAIDYGAQICSGIEHAHKKGIVHKDIKPHNIMITREGVLKITDFGIAKAMNAGTIASNTATLGSVHYFSPEQARGGYTDAKTDIYSLGVLLYEMVTGRLPFEGDTAVSIAMQHIEKTPIPPRNFNPEIPISFENVILKAMCKSPVSRYESATRMLVDLKKVYIGAEIPAEHDTVCEATTVIPKIPQDTIYKKNKDANPVPLNNSSSKKGDIISVLAGICTGVLLIALIVFFLFANPFSSCSGCSTSASVELPDFSDKTIEEAEELIEKMGSNIILVSDGVEYDKNKDPDVILSQDPAPGKKVKPDENGEIIVKITTNADEKNDTFDIPNVKNYKEQDARRILSDLELEVTISQENSDTVEEGYVIRQYPEANKSVSKGSIVTLYVSMGKEISEVIVPDFKDKTLEESKNILSTTGLDLKISEKSESSNTVEEGHIIRQSPTPGSKVSKGSTITIFVSSGKQKATLVTVPSFTNLSLQNAKAKVLQSGLSIGKIIYAESETVPAGNVIRQGIKSGTEVAENTEVDLQVSIGSSQTPSPTASPSDSNPTASAIETDNQ